MTYNKRFRITAIFIICLSLCALCGCTDKTVNYKIGIITGDAQTSPEAFYTTEAMTLKYGDTIIPSVYSKDSSEGALSASVLKLTENKNVKAIIFADSVKGIGAVIDNARKERPDILYICTCPTEETDYIASKADIVMEVDTEAINNNLVSQAQKMGATSFVFYSTKKHMTYQNILSMRSKIIADCSNLGLSFSEAVVPDPDENPEASADFISSDIAEKISIHGKNTAFFGTACKMQPAIIKSVLQNGAIYPGQCCPTPYHSYPEALGIDLSQTEGDREALYKSIKSILSEHSQEQRMSTWSYPYGALMIESGISYAQLKMKGTITENNDSKVMREIISNVSDNTSSAKEDSGNVYYISSDYVDFSKIS